MKEIKEKNPTPSSINLMSPCHKMTIAFFTFPKIIIFYFKSFFDILYKNEATFTEIVFQLALDGKMVCCRAVKW